MKRRQPLLRLRGRSCRMMTMALLRERWMKHWTRQSRMHWERKATVMSIEQAGTVKAQRTRRQPVTQRKVR